MKTITVSIICVICLVSNGSSQSIESKLDSFFTTLNNQHYLNGCVLIADKGEILYKNAFGYSVFNNPKELTTNSMFELASISKQFTAFGIMMLKKEEFLDYSTNITQILPEIPCKDITIRNLLNHTSGLIDYNNLIDKYWDKSKIINNDDVLKLIVEKNPNLLFKSGEKYLYSNTGYVLLALVIERLTGLNYEDFMTQKIFKPIGMERTKVYRRRYRPEIIDDYAYGYVLSLRHMGSTLPDNVEKHKRVIYADGLYGDGSISSTVEDLFIWDGFLYTEKLISQNEIQKAFEPGKLNNGDTIDIGYKNNSYGFGWRIQQTSDGKMVWHTGHYPGYSTLIMRYIDIDRTIICLSNNGYEFYTIMNTINNILNGQSIIIPRLFFASQLKRMLMNNDIAPINDSIKAMIKNKTTYIVVESRINELGYDLINLGRFNDAIAIFECNTELFPNSANVFDSLGEAYMANGNKDLAIKSYEKALELNPGMESAIKALKTLKGK